MGKIEKLTIDEKMKLYKKNFAIILNEIVKYIRENIRNNKHNATYDVPTLRKAVKMEMDSRIQKDGHYIKTILEHTPGNPSNYIHTEIVNSACQRYGEFMVRKHPHLNKPKTPRTQRRFRP